jgi:hypothetical protein
MLQSLPWSPIYYIADMENDAAFYIFYFLLAYHGILSGLEFWEVNWSYQLQAPSGSYDIATWVLACHDDVGPLGPSRETEFLNPFTQGTNELNIKPIKNPYTGQNSLNIKPRKPPQLQGLYPNFSSKFKSWKPKGCMIRVNSESSKEGGAIRGEMGSLTRCIPQKNDV